MGDVTRRAVLGVGAGAVGLAVVGTGATQAAAAPATKAVPLSKTAPRPVAPLRAHYTRAVGTVLEAVQGRHTFRLRLEHIADTESTPAAQAQAAFILVLAPTAAQRMPDGIYSLRGAGVPTQSLFLSSLGDAGRMQVVVNRYVPKRHG